MADLLIFDNVKPARLSLDELLGGSVGVWLFDEAEVEDVTETLPDHEKGRSTLPRPFKLTAGG